MGAARSAAADAAGGRGSAATLQIGMAVEVKLGLEQLHRSYPGHNWTMGVVKLEEQPAPKEYLPPSRRPYRPWQRAVSHGDLQQIYIDNLEQDLAVWRSAAQARKLSVQDLLRLLDSMGGHKLRSKRLVMIRAGRVSLLHQHTLAHSAECEHPCNYMVENMLADLRRWVAEDPSQWPDVAFYINCGDGSVCGKHNCTAPVFSVIKEWGEKRDADILVPKPVGAEDRVTLYFLPSEHKIGRAVFRGRGYCPSKTFGYEPKTCPRHYLAYKTQADPEWARYVDVGLQWNTTMLPPGAAEPVALRAHGFVPLHDLARFKYLLALDGITASSRFSKLLQINSPVLKQASTWIEWFYRSLTPGIHFVPFWHHGRDDLLSALQHLEGKDLYLTRVAANGQEFAYRYLHHQARRMYWQRALHEYKSLFGDMDAFVAAQPKLVEGGDAALAASSGGKPAAEQRALRWQRRR